MCLLFLYSQFKGTWLHKFNRKRTKEQEFFLAPRAKLNVQMMSNHALDVVYASDKLYGARLFELPFTVPSFSLLIILPEKKFAINEVEKRNDAKTLLSGNCQIEN